MGPIPEGHYANLPNGYRMHYLDEGIGPVVVFLHGSGSGASGYSNFKQNYPYLVDQGYRCIIPDHIGYGYSDKPDDVSYPLDFFVECIKQTLDVIGVSECALVGNSLGGAIALKIALDYPELVTKLVLMAPGGIEEQANYFTMPGMQVMKEVFTEAGVNRQSLKAFIEGALVHDKSVVNDALIDERFAIFQTQNMQVINTMTVPNMTDRLGEIGCPALVFWGLNEKMMPETGIMTLAKGLPDVKVILVSNCGHWVMVEHEAMFNSTTADFLADYRSE
jgi:4,5:9,10-diseco-3-hydroxy-5,9,17-trioxoandrosta-1(10),2-diene-4-oate hydrolase